MKKKSSNQPFIRNPEKIFVGDSLAGNDTVNQAREFHKQVKFDCSILTKSDADARGGAALSVKVTSSPITRWCTDTQTDRIYILMFHHYLRQTHRT